MVAQFPTEMVFQIHFSKRIDQMLKLFKKAVTAAAVLTAVAGGILTLNWARKKSDPPGKDPRKKRDELKTLLKEIVQETLETNINPKLHRLKELFQTH
jgi:hypothetical protein